MNEVYSGWDYFLKEVKDDITGIIHIGSSWGQEVGMYDKLLPGKPILHFEPLKSEFDKLAKNIEPYPLQIAEMIAIGDEDTEISFWESGKKGVSSSVLEPKEHLRLWPGRTFKEIKVPQRMLDSYFESSTKMSNNYNTIVMDTQGYEIQAFNGMPETLKGIKYIALEVWTVEEVYKGSAMYADIVQFLDQRGYHEIKAFFGYDHFGKAFFQKN